MKSLFSPLVATVVFLLSLGAVAAQAENISTEAELNQRIQQYQARKDRQEKAKGDRVIADDRARFQRNSCRDEYDAKSVQNMASDLGRPIGRAWYQANRLKTGACSDNGILKTDVGIVCRWEGGMPITGGGYTCYTQDGARVGYLLYHDED
jgi:hypothetical protein